MLGRGAAAFPPSSRAPSHACRLAAIGAVAGAAFDSFRAFRAAALLLPPFLRSSVHTESDARVRPVPWAEPKAARAWWCGRCRCSCAWVALSAFFCGCDASK